jgi:hypothetical protein
MPDFGFSSDGRSIMVDSAAMQKIRTGIVRLLSFMGFAFLFSFLCF